MKKFIVKSLKVYLDSIEQELESMTKTVKKSNRVRDNKW